MITVPSKKKGKDVTLFNVVSCADPGIFAKGAGGGVGWSRPT